ncbi:hypothetical protein M758_12G018400 [Ceratodon purpureus]|nr:hypothetical protein M758_12G018400 [Ceratodon purpureus]
MCDIIGVVHLHGHVHYYPRRRPAICDFVDVLHLCGRLHLSGRDDLLGPVYLCELTVLHRRLPIPALRHCT